nr:putative ribonuclease H-like domain-containing protein [Tanacetum cinerariifolium]
MDLESTQNNAVAKLPLLKQGDYEMWKLRIEQYFQVQDYALWDVIENGNSFKPVSRTATNADGTSTSTIPGPVTTKEKAQKKNHVKAKSMLLMALSNEHLLIFSQYKDAKTLFEAMQARFGGNDAIKKTQKTLLKQMYKNFDAPSTENKADLDTMSIEQEVKRTLTTSSSSGSQNMAFLSSSGSINKVDTANIQLSTVSTPVITVSTHDNTANLSDATVYAFLANQPNGSQLVHEDLEQIHEDDLEEMDLKWPRNLDNSKKTVNVEDTSSKAMVEINGACFDWSYMADDETPTNMALMAFSDSEVHNGKTCSNTCLKSFETLKTQYDNLRIEFNKSEFDLATYKRGLASVEEQLVFYKKNEVMFCDQIAVLRRDASFRDSEINALNLQIEKLKKEKESNQNKINIFDNASKSLDKLIGSQISDNSRTGLGFASYNAIAPSPTGLFAFPTIGLSNSGLEEFQHPEFEGYEPKAIQKPVLKNVEKRTGQKEVRPVWNNTMRINHQNLFNSKRNFAPTTVLTKSGIVPISTARQSSSRAPTPVSAARPINTAAPKPLVNVAKPRQNALHKSHSLSRRPFYQQTTLKNRNLKNKVNTAKVNSVNTAKGNRVTSAVGKQGINVVKSSACWVWRHKIKVHDHVSKNNGSYICKRFDYVDPEGRLKSEHDGGYVAFGGGAKGGKITGKGTIRTADESHVLLKVPRKNNMLTWVFFLATKNETIRILKKFITEIENLVDKKVKIIRYDNGTKFKNTVMNEFCEEKCIKKEYSVARTPQQNRVAERKNRGRSPALSFMRPFKCHVTILNTLDQLGKFDRKSDEEIFVGYSTISKAFRVYNTRTRKVKKNLHITFFKNKPMITGGGSEWLFDIDALSESMNYALVPAGTNSNDFADNSLFDSSSQDSDGPNKDKHGPSQESECDNQERPNAESSTKILPVNTATPTYADYPSDPLMPDLKDTGIFNDAYDDIDEGAEVDYNNLETVILVGPILSTRVHKDHPKEQIIGETKKDIDYDEVFAPAARIEAIRLFLAYASFMDFTVYQMDVKSAFLYGTIEEEVYVSQPPGFADPKFPYRVYKVEKALYGLHQTFRAWYETLSTYLLENGFRKGTIDKTLVIKQIKNDILLVQVYVDDIIFGFTKKSLSTEFENLMHKRFQMSSMRELTFFLGLQVEQRTYGIFLSQDKYVCDILKKFGFSSVKSASTPIETHKPLSIDAAGTYVDVHLYRFMIGSLMYLTSSRPDIMFDVCACLRFQVQPKVSHMHAVKRIFRYIKGQPTLGIWYPKDLPLKLIAYSDSDYACASLDRKSTTGGCQFLGSRIISWQCKKQTIVANSSTKAKYIAASNCCGQVLWLQNQLLDYGYNFMQTKIHVDNKSAICVVKNHVYHSKTKHIKIRHHFIRDSYEKRLIEMVKIHTNYNVADLLTKAFDVIRF